MSRLVPSRLSVTVDGDTSFDFEDDVELRVVTIDLADEKSLKFLSVGMEKLRTLEGGAAFRIAFDLVGAYRGPGDYEIPAVGGQVTAPSIDPRNPDPNAAASGLSRVYLTYNRGGDPTKKPETAAAMQLFENPVAPCDLSVGKNGESGRLECPEVADANGQIVSIEMEWSRP